MHSQTHLLTKAAWTGLALSGVGGTALAQGLHDADFLVRINDSALEAGGVEAGGGTVYPSFVRSARFGAEGFANFTNDPGVNSEVGVLIPGMAIGFDLVAALREWDGDDFDAVSDDTVTARDGGVTLATTPATDQVIAGDVFGEADNDAGAVFHSHVQFFLNYPSVTPIDGVWLMQWRLWTDEPGIAGTETLYVVFSQGTGDAQVDDAVAWVESNLLGAMCAADIDGDGDADPDDIAAFVDAFTDGVAGTADIDNDGDEDPDDIQAFVDAFVTGCP